MKFKTFFQTIGPIGINSFNFSMYHFKKCFYIKKRHEWPCLSKYGLNVSWEYNLKQYSKEYFNILSLVSDGFVGYFKYNLAHH